MAGRRGGNSFPIRLEFFVETMPSDNSLSYDSFESRRLFDGCNWQVAKKENGETLSLPLCRLDPLGPSDDVPFPRKGKHGLERRMKSRASRARALPWLSAFARTYKCLFLRPLNGTWGWSLEKLKRVAKQEITFHEVNPERRILGSIKFQNFPFYSSIVPSIPLTIHHKIEKIYSIYFSKLGILIIFKRKLLNKRNWTISEQNLISRED